MLKRLTLGILIQCSRDSEPAGPAAEATQVEGGGDQPANV